MLCFLIFADNLLRRIEGSGATAWFWLSSGTWEMIVPFGVLSVVCQLVFWSAVTYPAIVELESGGPIISTSNTMLDVRRVF
jgi:hypothetical protein